MPTAVTELQYISADTNDYQTSLHTTNLKLQHEVTGLPAVTPMKNPT